MEGCQLETAEYMFVEGQENYSNEKRVKGTLGGGRIREEDVEEEENWE